MSYCFGNADFGAALLECVLSTLRTNFGTCGDSKQRETEENRIEPFVALPILFEGTSLFGKRCLSHVVIERLRICNWSECGIGYFQATTPGLVMDSVWNYDNYFWSFLQLRIARACLQALSRSSCRAKESGVC